MEIERESFLALLDETESLINGDPLREETEEFEYSVSSKKEEKKVVEKKEESENDASTCSDCGGFMTRGTYASPLLNNNPLIFFIALSPEGDTIFNTNSEIMFNNWLKAIDVRRSEIALSTLVKCPMFSYSSSACDTCKHYLREEIASIKPRSIVLLGEDVSRYMLNYHNTSFSYFHAHKFSLNGIPTFSTNSPMDVVRDSSLRRIVWDDLRFIISSIRGNN